MKNEGKAGLARKEAILRAAIELFAQKGFQAASTAEVARLAGVSEGIIFYHFQNKEGILVHLLTRVLEDYLGGLAHATAGAATGMEAIERYIDFHFGQLKEKAQIIMLVVRDFPVSLTNGQSPQAKRVHAMVAALHGLITDLLRRGQGDGTIRECPLDETSLILRSLLNGAARVRLLGLDRERDLSAEAKDFCRRALAPLG